MPVTGRASRRDTLAEHTSTSPVETPTDFILVPNQARRARVPFAPIIKPNLDRQLIRRLRHLLLPHNIR